ncbi:HpcH/HpaI aldolase/citrate lyase family protein [Parapontixanthobacter aurantiacus]|nr:CoA ester lyase [Parapontixanthobacter aurantiacus]
MTDRTRRAMRSWLFAPGDSEKKMSKCAESAADIAILDLEDAVAPDSKNEARQILRDFLSTYDGDKSRVFVRVNPLDGPHTLADLAAVMPARPGGIMLPKVYGRQDVETLDKYLEAFEVANDMERGSTQVIVLVTETAESMFHCGDFKNAPRLVAMTWGAEDLADSLGASANTEPDGSFGFTYELARSMCLLGAATAGVTAIETIQADFRDLDALRVRADKVRRAGFQGMLAIHPAQIDVINEAFTPGEEELAEAREIVALFEANPGAGTIGHNGKMLDRPHLARARNLLAAADLN